MLFRSQPKRDLVGYAARPPDPKWPDGARVAVNFVMNYEEGSEPSVQDGEGYTETGLTESTSSSMGLKGRDLAGESMFEFGSRAGFWRLMRAFAESYTAAWCSQDPARVAAHFRQTREIVDVDGARVIFPQGWGLVRASNTQPVLVMRFEAESPELLAAYRAEVEEVLIRETGAPLVETH